MFVPGALGLLLVVIGPLILIGGIVLMLVPIFGNDKTTDFVVAFVVDFSESPPRWQSDDDEFWKDVKQFFFAESLTS